MRFQLGSLVSILTIGAATPTTAAVDLEANHADSLFDGCGAQRHALVMLLQQDALATGRQVDITRKANGAVLIDYGDYYQRIHCRDDAMYVDFPS